MDGYRGTRQHCWFFRDLQRKRGIYSGPPVLVGTNSWVRQMSTLTVNPIVVDFFTILLSYTRSQHK